MKQLQGHGREMKRAKTAAVHLEQLIDLKNLALKYFEPMPPPLSLNVRFQLKSIIDECVEERLGKGEVESCCLPFSVLQTWRLRGARLE